MGFRVLGFMVYGSSLGWVYPGLSGLGFRVRDSACRASSHGLRVTGDGFRVSGHGFRVSSFGFRVLDLR